MDDHPLVIKARQAAEKAYSPYMHFPVGAALETESGDIFEGCNVTNASTGLGVCAERTAVFNAVVHGHQDLKRIAVAVIKGDPSQPETLMPCGACRQVLAEFMNPEAEIIIDKVGTFRLKDLLPSPFKLSIK